jgi:cell division protein FtsW (lipid II flippase)
MTRTALPAPAPPHLLPWQLVAPPALGLLVAAGVASLDLAGGPLLPAVATAAVGLLLLVLVRSGGPEQQAVVLAVTVLSAIGLLTQARVDGAAAVRTQLLWVGLAVAALIGVRSVLRRTRGLPPAALVQWTGVALLLLPLVPGLGRTVSGARAWIEVAGFTAQPVELARPLLVVGVALALHEVGPLVRQGRVWVAVRAAFPVCLSVALLGGLHRDLGPALVIAMTSAVLFVLTRPRRVHLAGFGLAVVALSIIAYVFVGHLRDRVSDWLHPVDADGAIENTGLALRSLARGGVWGTGLGRGRPGTVANAKNDFVLVAVTEERGVVGALCVVGLLAVMSLVLLRIAARVADDRRRIATAGLAVMFTVHSLYVVLATASVVPLTGIVVPFVSAGGSAFIGMAIVIGGVLGMAGRPPARPSAVVRHLGAGLRSASRMAAATWAVAMAALLVATFFSPVGPGQPAVPDLAERGRLLSADGVVLAATVRDERGEVERHYLDAVSAPLLDGWQGLDRATADRQTCLPSAWDQLWDLPCPPADVVLGLDTSTQAAAVAALEGRAGSLVVLDLRSFTVLADHTTDGVEPSLSSGPPGSVFKLVVAAAAIEHEIETTTPRERFYLPPGGIGEVPNADDQVCGGPLEEALAQSCNTSFARMAVDLGPEGLRETVRDFGFDAPAPVADRNPGSSVLGPVPDVDALARTGFGQQDVEATVLQMAVVAGVIGRNGTRLDARYVTGRCVAGRFVAAEPGEPVQVMSPGAAERIRAGMAASVDHGTASRLVGVAGGALAKTGSAQTGRGTTDAWLVALAPAAAPRVAVAVRLAGGGDTPDLTGGRDAIEPARAVLNQALVATSENGSRVRSCG